MLLPSSPVDAVSHYDTAPLRATLVALVDFDLINSGQHALQVGAVNVKPATSSPSTTRCSASGRSTSWRAARCRPAFPPPRSTASIIWDGGLVSNTPLQWVFDDRPRQDTLAFQVDLWSARGELPRNLIDAEVRQKEIQFSSRTRAGHQSRQAGAAASSGLRKCRASNCRPRCATWRTSRCSRRRRTTRSSTSCT